MGSNFLDQYTYLHFASGIIAYYWNISFKTWLVLHTIFEIIENTKTGVNFINKRLWFWPGGKPGADTFINIIGDTLGTIIGWGSAYYLDKIGAKNKWYKSHLN